MISPSMWRRVCLRAALAVVVLVYARPTPAPTFEKVGDLPSGRTGACMVSGQDGKVYTFFGKRPATGVFTETVDVYDTRTGRWTTLSSDPAPPTHLRVGATATLLQNGKIVIFGGVSPAGQVLPTSVIFDPRAADGDKWRSGPTMTYRRTRHGTTLLSDGRVLVHGGAGCLASGSCTEPEAASLGTSEIYDPAAGTFLLPQFMPLGADRYDHVGVFIADGHDPAAGDVRLFGGFRGVVGGVHTPVETTLLYSDGEWCYAASVYSTQKGARTIAPLLHDGRIALLGGTADEATPVSAMSLYDPAGYCGTETVTAVPTPPGYIARWGLTGAVLSDGKVLIAGGWTNATTPAHTVQILTFSGDGAPGIETLASVKRADHNTTVLPTGEVLIVGGQNPDMVGPPPAPDVIATEKYDPADGRYCTAAPIGGFGAEQPLLASSSVLLPSGRSLVAFGVDESGAPTRKAFVFDPDGGGPSTCPELPQGQWTPVPDRPIAEGGAAADNRGVSRRRAPIVLLKNGSALVIGGDGGGGGGGMPLDSVRIFSPQDPTAGPWGTWRDAAPMNHARRGHTATVLKDGKVFVYGGIGVEGTALDSWEIYDPLTNTWTDGADPAPLLRTDHSATLLRTGGVLLVGGRDESGTISAETQHFDPGSDPFDGIIESRAPMATPRAGASVIVLPNDITGPTQRVLVAFGDTPSGPTNKSEVYDPVADTWTQTDPARDGRQARSGGHRSVLMLNGKVLSVAGIETPAPAAVEQEVYDPELRQWFATGTNDPLGTPWTEPAAVVLLNSGAALVAGGARAGALLVEPASDEARLIPPKLVNISNCPLIYRVADQKLSGVFAIEAIGERFAKREAGSAAGNQKSSSAPPVVITKGIDNDQMSPATPLPGSWTNTYFHGSLPAGTIPGHYQVTVISAGLPSVAKVVRFTPEWPPENPDADRDGFGALSDCDDTNPLTWSRPGEVRSLTLTHDPAVDATTLRWQAPVILGAVSVVYDTLVSPDPSNFVVDALCVESDEGTDTESVTTEAPPPGAVHCYLVRAQNACPDGEGPLGQGSDGAERPGRACP